MADKSSHDRHEQAAYEAAIIKKINRKLEEDFARYKNNARVTLGVENPQPSDFEGCVE